ncbi:hypothetical protein CCP2SC5_100066 [Azospirillaceae bacterium]
MFFGGLDQEFSRDFVKIKLKLVKGGEAFEGSFREGALESCAFNKVSLRSFCGKAIEFRVDALFCVDMLASGSYFCRLRSCLGKRVGMSAMRPRRWRLGK